MKSLSGHLHMVPLAAALALLIPTAGRAQGFEEARIYIEYNETANNLGFHVSLDGEDWTDLKIFDPTGKKNLRRLGRRRIQEPGAHGAFL